MDFVSPEEGVFLSTMPASRSQRRLALAIVLIATILFLASAPFVKQAELRRLSVADPLTAITNRRSFDEALQTEWKRALADRTTLALLLIDVDCFKSFNDSYGHVVGDRCLRTVAEVLSNGARRAGETIARYGGDEFAILLPRTDPERAAALARHLCDCVRGVGLAHAHSIVAPHVTISIGVASISMAQQTNQFAAEPTVLVEAADRALYAAKAAGRDRVCENAIGGGVVGRMLPATSAATPSTVRGAAG